MTQDQLNQKLLNAARSDNTQDAQAALATGANPNASDDYQRTPLHWAAANGHEDLARLLIERGAYLEASDSSLQTPLHWATQQGHTDIARLLIENGADVDAEDKFLQTPLHLATVNDHADLAALLATAGRWRANVNPLLGQDGRLDARQLVDEGGRPTDALRTLLPDDQFGQLARPESYRQGMDGLVLVFPHLPETVQAAIDLTPYRRSKARKTNQSDTDGGWVQRYTRRTPRTIE